MENCDYNKRLEQATYKRQRQLALYSLEKRIYLNAVLKYLLWE